MPSGPFAHVCMLVHDLDRAIEDWTKLLNVLDPHQLDEPIVRYDTFGGGDDDGLAWGCFVSHHGAEIQFMQPAPGTPLGRRLEKHGEGVHHLCFTTDDVPGTMARLKEAGIKTLGDETYSDPDTAWQEWAWVSSESGHGVLIEVAKPYRAVDGRWEPGTVTGA
jgi:methylmalonyl-CoA/ethylmalonyl-CoA epimerase